MTIDINLIPVKTRQQKWGKPLAITAGALLVLVLAWLIFLYVWNEQVRHTETNQLTLLKKTLQQIETNDHQHTTELLALQTEVNQLKLNSTHIEALLMTFVKLLPPNGTMTNFDYQNGVLTLSGTFKSLNDVAGFDHAIQTSSLVSQATMDKVGSGSSSPGANTTLATKSGGYSADFTIQIDQKAYAALGGGQ